MRIIRAPTLARAHELAVRTVLEKGWVLETENDEATIECEELALEVESPESEPMASPASRFQQRFLDAYAENLLHGSDAKFEYDYHRRLFDWGERLRVAPLERPGCSAQEQLRAAPEGRPGHSVQKGLTAKDEDVHVDQIDYIARKLEQAKNSRRAVAVTWNPVVDENLDDCPCLQLVQCLLRDGKLQMKVVFRSNDILSAAGANMYALVRLQKAIADRLGVPCGRYTHIALVPHVYYRRDLNDIEPFCKSGTEIRPVDEVCRACGKCPRSSGA
ncbi:thymidylate synthase [Methanoculleus sp.]|uniref:thymidylate synthase n=1 Tax=Methanoculleus sp. TaxID=90427 RepID=UPI001BD5B31A|nr:thymidylate synthase [Methanoculleus sp.]